MEMLVALEEGHLTGQIRLLTNVVKRAILRNTAGQREMDLVGTYPISLQMISQNGLLRILFF